MAPKILERKVAKIRLVLYCGTLSRYESDDNNRQLISFASALIERSPCNSVHGHRSGSSLKGSSSICVKANGLVFSNALIGQSDLVWEMPKVAGDKRQNLTKTPCIYNRLQDQSGGAFHRD